MQDTNYYDLTPSQKLLFYSMKYTPHKQINNIFVLMLVQKKLDFNVLRSAIEAAYEQNDCFRLRIVKTGKQLKQFFADSEKPEIRFLDFSGRTKKSMDRRLGRLARTPIKTFNRPMTRIFLVRTPDGLDGIYYGVNHIIMDMWAISVFMGYVMSTYESMKNGTPPPSPLSQYEPLLQKELSYKDTPQYPKDKEFWQGEFSRLPEPMYSSINGRSVLEKNRRKYKNPNLRYGSIFTLHTAARHEVINIPGNYIEQIATFCEQYRVSMQSVFMFGLRHALSRLNERQEDITFFVTVARRATLSEKRTCGTRAQSTRFRTIFDECCTFEQACKEISDYQAMFYRHSDINSIELMRMESAHYGKPGLFNSYNAGLFTFQPIKLALSDGTPISTEWYCNGAFATSFYLCIMDADGTGGLRCCYEYQYKNIKLERLYMMHAIMMQSIMAGVKNPDITIGKLLDMSDEKQQSAEIKLAEAAS